MSASLPLVQRFQRARWTDTRRKIDSMLPGEILELSESEYFNAKASVERLNDAYQGTRKWILTVRKGFPLTIKRIEH